MGLFHHIPGFFAVRIISYLCNLHGIKKFIGSYAAEMNGLDVVVFTAGLGENSAILREWVCTDMDFLGIQMDNDKNANSPRGQEIDVSAGNSRVRILVIPTDEELMIAKDTAALVNGQA